MKSQKVKASIKTLKIGSTVNFEPDTKESSNLAGTIVRIIKSPDGKSLKFLIDNDESDLMFTEDKIENLIKKLNLKKKDGLKIEKDGIF